MTDFRDLARVAGPTNERPPFTFAAAVRVAFSDTDAQSIVYYGRYAPYFDVARVEYLRNLGLAAHDSNIDGEFVMRHFEIDYHAPAMFDDLLEVFCRIERIGTSSMAFDYATINAESGVLLATARQVMVNVDMEARRPMAVPEHTRAKVSAFEGW